MRNVHEEGARPSYTGILIQVLLLLVILAVAVWLLEFEPTGYRMTVPMRNYTQILPNVYIENGYTGNVMHFMAVYKEALERVEAFWGERISEPRIVFSHRAESIEKAGGNHDACTVVLPGMVQTYISLTEEYWTADILSHEMNHAELHARLYQDRKVYTQLVPAWFDEGVCLQTDLRDSFDEDSWALLAESAEELPVLASMETGENFFAGSAEERRIRYTVSRHELAVWLEARGSDGLIALLEQVSTGTPFASVYAPAS